MNQYEVRVRKVTFGSAVVKAKDEKLAKTQVTPDNIVWNKEVFEMQDVVCIEENVVVLAYPELMR